jgi:hypothetical protein
MMYQGKPENDTSACQHKMLNKMFAWQQIQFYKS